MSALDLSCLDYCNSLLSGCPQYLLKSTKVQSNPACLVLRVPQTDHISLIQYRHASLCYNCLSLTAPCYLTELLKVYKPSCQLQSSDAASFSPHLPPVHTLAWSEASQFFLMLNHQSGTVSPEISSRQTIPLIACVCVCVCADTLARMSLLFSLFFAF